jgi:hypothetical protein
MSRVTTAPQQNIKTAIPDLADIPLEQVDELGGNVLAESIALYRERLKEERRAAVLVQRADLAPAARDVHPDVARR